MPFSPNENMSLEDWAAQTAVQIGEDPNDPETQQEISRIVNLARNQLPDVPDHEIIKQVSAGLQEYGPKIAKGMGFDPDKYNQMMKQYNFNFGPEAVAKNEAELQDRNKGIDVGDALGSIGATVGGLQTYKAHKEQVAGQRAQAKEEVVGGFERQMKAADKEMKQQFDAMTMEEKVLDMQTRRDGLRQAQEERADKMAQAQSNANPQSVTSISKRQLAEKFAPKMAAQLKEAGSWDKLSGADLDKILPQLEKAYEAELKAEEKRLDRESRETVAREGNATREAIAGLRIDNAADRRAEAERRKADEEARRQEKADREKSEKVAKIDQTANGLENALKNLNRADELAGSVITGQYAGPVAGLWKSSEREEFDRLSNMSELQAAISFLKGQGQISNAERLIAKGTIFSSDKSSQANKKAIADLKAAIQQDLDTVKALRKKLDVPRVGEVVDGFRFKGGDPAKQESWEKAQ